SKFSFHLFFIPICEESMRTSVRFHTWRSLSILASRVNRVLHEAPVPRCTPRNYFPVAASASPAGTPSARSRCPYPRRTLGHIRDASWWR
ncbi:hypothetical protein PFISCL1PPCAC_16449, partial [Pristionchus fissidentatus]